MTTIVQAGIILFININSTHIEKVSFMTDVVAALIWDNDRFLACQRPANKARALLWEFVGGKVEPNETKENAIVREIKEELDIDIQVEKYLSEKVFNYPEKDINLIMSKKIKEREILVFDINPKDNSLHTHNNRHTLLISHNNMSLDSFQDIT